MAKKRRPNYLNEYHGSAVDPNGWRSALKRRKKAPLPNPPTEAYLIQLSREYTDNEIGASVYGIAFLNAINKIESESEVSDEVLKIKSYIEMLPGFDPFDDTNELDEESVRTEIGKILRGI